MESGSQQLELFSGTRNVPEASSGRRDSFFGHIRNYEKMILVAIGAIIIAVAAFALGVEKGKRLAMPQQQQPVVSRLPVASVPQQAQAAIQPKAVSSTVAAVPQQGYTIQLASFKNSGLARKEAEALKKRGFTPFIALKGNYSILCVGNFNSKENAKPLLSEIKKIYPDSFIRRL